MIIIYIYIYEIRGFCPTTMIYISCTNDAHGGGFCSVGSGLWFMSRLICGGLAKWFGSRRFRVVWVQRV